MSFSMVHNVNGVCIGKSDPFNIVLTDPDVTTETQITNLIAVVGKELLSSGTYTCPETGIYNISFSGEYFGSTITEGDYAAIYANVPGSKISASSLINPIANDYCYLNASRAHLLRKGETVTFSAKNHITGQLALTLNFSIVPVNHKPEINSL